MHITELISSATSPLIVHIPSTAPLLELDQEGYDFYRNNGIIDLSLHSHWQALIGKGTLHLVLTKPEPPLIRFYTKLGTALEGDGLEVSAISQAIYSKIANFLEPVVLENSQLFALTKDSQISPSSEDPKKLQRVLQRSRPLHIVLSCK